MNLNPIFNFNEVETIEAKTPEGTTVPLRLHDADTLYPAEGAGQGIRIPNADAAEVSKLTSTGGFSAGSLLGAAQTEAGKQIINDYGFNKIVPTNKSSYNRDVADLENAQGERYSEFLVKHRIVEPNTNTPDRVMVSRSMQLMSEGLSAQKEKTPVQKARELVDNVLSNGTQIWKPQATTIEQFQDYEGRTSHKGLAQQEEQIKALEKRLGSEKITDAQKIKIGSDLAALKEGYQTNLNLPKHIYTSSLEGMNTKVSRGTFGEWGRAWDIGWLNVEDSASNILQWVGHSTGSEDMRKSGKQYSLDIERKKRLVDLTVGDKDITGGTLTTLDDVSKDITKVFRFIGTTTLQYGPQMAVMIGGSAAGATAGAVAGPAGIVAGSNIVPMLMGIGDVYGEMPDDEKDPLVAAALGSTIGLIDKFSISKGALKPADLLTKEGVHKTATKLAAIKGIPEAEALALLHKGVKEIGRDYALVARSVAVDQLAARKGLNSLILDISKNAGTEAATEAVQEAIQYIGIRNTSSLDFDWNELYKRTKDAAIVGGLLGGEFGAVSAMKDKADFNMNLNMLEGVETKPLTRNSMIEQEEIQRNGQKLDDLGLAGKNRNYSKGVNNINDLILPGTQPKTVYQRLGGLFSNGGLFKQTRDNVLSDYIHTEGGRELAGLFDANIVRGVYSGLSPFKRIHAIANSVLSLLPDSQKNQELFGTTNSKDIGHSVLMSVTNNTPTPATNYYRSQLDILSSQLANYLQNLDPSGQINNPIVRQLQQPDFFVKNQLVNPALVMANKKEFIDLLVNNYKPKNSLPGGTNRISPTYAEDLANRIATNFTHHEMSELDKIGLLDNPVLNKFRSTDLEHNVVKMVEMITRSGVRTAMFGANGEVVGNAIKKMLDAGQIDANKASHLAVEISEMVSAFDGRLHKSDNPLVQGVTDNINFVTTLVYMDTSLFANLAEAVYGALGLSPKQVTKYFGIVAKEFASDIVSKLTQVGSKITGGAIRPRDEHELSANLNKLQFTGHYGKINDVAFNVGANIQTQSKANLSKLMFKFNLVESSTNAIRAARGAIASDEITHLVSIIAESPNNNDVTRWARDRLSYYRMDPDELITIYNKLGSISTEALFSMQPGDPMFDKLATQLTYGVTNFIDEFSSRPEPGSTARIFDDQRFALFTQFKKFTWHFTSNVVPQLWNMYIKRGNPAYTYSAFSLMMTSFAVAYAGLYLKSMLRGEDDKEDDESKLGKRLKQAFDYSIGAAPADLLNTIKEATAERQDGSLKNSPFKTLVSQSPGLNLMFNSGKDIYNIATKEDDAKNKSNLIRRIPVFGEIPEIRKMYEKEN